MRLHDFGAQEQVGVVSSSICKAEMAGRSVCWSGSFWCYNPCTYQRVRLLWELPALIFPEIFSCIVALERLCLNSSSSSPSCLVEQRVFLQIWWLGWCRLFSFFENTVYLGRRAYEVGENADLKCCCGSNPCGPSGLDLLLLDNQCLCSSSVRCPACSSHWKISWSVMRVTAARVSGPGAGCASRGTHDVLPGWGQCQEIICLGGPSDLGCTNWWFCSRSVCGLMVWWGLMTSETQGCRYV